MPIVPRWLFRLFYISGLAVVLISSFAIVQEIFREPLRDECTLAPVDEKEWYRYIEEDQEAQLQKWENLSQKEVALELDRRYQKHFATYLLYNRKSSNDLAEVAFVYYQWGLAMFAAIACLLVFWCGFFVTYEFLRKQSANFLELQEKGKISETSFWRRWLGRDKRKSLMPKWVLWTATLGLLVPSYYFLGLAPMFASEAYIYSCYKPESPNPIEKLPEKFKNDEASRVGTMLKKSREEMIHYYLKHEFNIRKRFALNTQLELRKFLIHNQPGFAKLFFYLYTGMILWVVFHMWLLWRINRKVSRKVASLSVPS